MPDSGLTPRAERQDRAASLILCGMVVLMGGTGLGLQAWHAHREWRRYLAGAKVPATITAIEPLSKGTARASLAFRHLVRGRSLVCRTQQIVSAHRFFAGETVLVVPTPNSCFEVAGPYPGEPEPPGHAPGWQ